MFQAAPVGSVILLHACAHNPTGLDPTTEQWERIADVIQVTTDMLSYLFLRGSTIFPFSIVHTKVSQVVTLIKMQRLFGFLSNVAWNYFAHNLSQKIVVSTVRCCDFLLQIDSAERVGTLNVLCLSENAATAVRSQLKAIVRANYSSPPIHGALIVFLILSRPELCQEW
jgi:aspartate/tyrosine/aromatic aminotransferase